MPATKQCSPFTVSLSLYFSLDSIGRYAIEANKPKVFADAVKMIGTSTGGATAVAEVGAKDLATQPADGETVRSALPLIKSEPQRGWAN